ncbi:MAG: 3-phosphoglycerate dehydrogenase [Dehalococcoidia bacterium]|nr:3-phosphoglycerate dehydrogenase [Dehalococcoidia bacterium]
MPLKAGSEWVARGQSWATGAMPRLTVLYYEQIPADVERIVRSEVPPEVQLLTLGPNESRASTVKLERADCLLVADGQLGEATFAQAPRLRHIQHQGVGYDNIDVAAAHRRGISVALTPEGTTRGVAEHTLLLILALYKHLCVADRALREGQWLRWELRPTSWELGGKTVGIVGFGRIGRAVAQRIRAFEADVIYTDIVRAPTSIEEDLAARYVTFDELLASADVVTVHVPMNADSRHLVGRAQLERMQPHAILINTSRGGLVDEKALHDALTDGLIAAAGLDVFEPEPPSTDNPLWQLPNVVVTPHIAAGSADALREKMRAAFANIQRAARGEPLAHQVEI